MKIVDKVGAFVIRPTSQGCSELLLFLHRDYPEAPIQIPGGTIDPGESPEEALWRELKEESGLSPLPLIRKLGISEVPWNDLLLRRHCCLLNGIGLPESWEHTVTGGGVDQGMTFAYAWHQLEPTFALTGDCNHYLNPQSIPELYQLRG